MDALYVIGEPGIGKSTFVRTLTANAPYEDGTSPFAFRRYDCGVWELGARRKDYPGTDALAMSVQPEVVRFLEGVKPTYLLAEGDRLGNRKFFDALVRLGYRLAVVVLDGPEVADMRRKLRGSEQNDTWLKGRRTKVAKLAEGDPHWQTFRLAAHRRPEELVSAVAGHPVAQRLLGPVEERLRSLLAEDICS